MESREISVSTPNLSRYRTQHGVGEYLEMTKDSGTECLLDVLSTPPPTPAVVASSNGGIIGNKRTKVYHRPDCPGAVKVSLQNRVRFATEAEAQAAGYRLAGNCP